MSQGRIESIHIAPAAKSPMQEVSEVLAIPGVGLDGDRLQHGLGDFTGTSLQLGATATRPPTRGCAPVTGTCSDIR